MELQNNLQPNIEQNVSRCVPNFPPTLWRSFASFSFPDSEYEAYTKRVELLKKNVRDLLMAATKTPIQKVELIDTLCRLGVSYHLEMEIGEQLNNIFEFLPELLQEIDNNLYIVALVFRVTREYGYKISCDVFKKFIDNDGKFKKALINDVKGILSLYEASFLSVHGDDILDEALVFTKPILESSLAMELSPYFAQHIRNALILPFHKSMPRFEAMKYIAYYEQCDSPNQTLLEFAKLDFNRVQLLHKQELGELARWWKDLNLIEKFPYARNRIVEPYVWASMQYEPEFRPVRLLVTKFLLMVSICDDTYDSYGTIEELNAFTSAIERLNIGAINELPEYMKYFYKAILDLFEEANNIVLKQGRLYSIDYAKEKFKELLRAYHKESQWSNDGYVPTFGEYLGNGATSAGFGVIVAVSLIGMQKFAGIQEYEWLKVNPKILTATMMIGRLLNDIASHEDEQKRGDCASSVECYQKEYGVTEEKAIEEIRKICANSWKDINEEYMKPSSIPKPLLKLLVNLARLAEVYYRFDDSYTNPSSLKDVVSLYIEPFTILK